MPDVRYALQNLADAISPETGTQDGFIDTVDTSIKRIADALPGKLAGSVEPTDIANAVSDYLDEHPEAVTVEVDTSLTQQGAAADAKAVGDAIVPLAEYTDALKVELDLTDTTAYFRRTGFINDSGVFIKASSTTDQHVYVPKLYGVPNTMIVTANPSYSAEIGFVTGVTTSNGTAITFAGQETGKHILPAGTSKRLTIPKECSFIYIYIGTQDEDHTPSEVYFVKDISRNAYDAVADLCGTWTKVDLSSITSAKYWWDGTNSDGFTVTTNGYTKLIPVTAGQKVRITQNGARSAQYMLLRDTLTSIGDGNQITNNRPCQYLNTSNVIARVDEFTVPDGYNNLYIFDHQVGASTRLPSKVEVMTYGATDSSGDDSSSEASTYAKLVAADEVRVEKIGLVPLSSTDSDGWERPTTLQQLNVIRWSNRMRFLRWTPLRDVSSRGTNGISPAGVTFAKGVPYSSNWQDYKYVGITMSIYTFLTMVNNPYSLLYTESLKSSDPRSAWGRHWVVTNGTTYCGTVCIAFTAAVTGSELVWNNPQIENVREFSVIDHIKDVDPNNLQIGDILNDDQHGVVVYALKKDANGNVTHIKVAQSSGTSTGCNIATDTIENRIATYIARNNGGVYLYKYNNLYKNTKFDPEPTDIAEIDQILSDDSVVTYPSPVAYTKEICTFAGDKASFARGVVGGNNLIVINYNLDGASMGGYDRIRLYHADDPDAPYLASEYTIAEANASLTNYWTRDTSFSTDNYPTVDMTNHALVVSSHAIGLDSGKYYAVLSDGTIDSTYKTEFELLSNKVETVEDLGDAYKFTLAEPICACYIGTLNTDTGDTYIQGTIKHELTRAEEVGKYILVDKNDLTGYDLDELYVRLHMKGEYGTACPVVKLFTEL